MNSKIIFSLLSILFYANNTYASLVGEEDAILPSNNYFGETEMTATVPPKSLPTNKITATKTVTVPVQTNVPMKEDTVTLLYRHYYNNYDRYLKIWKFNTVNATVPANVDDVHIQCYPTDISMDLAEMPTNQNEQDKLNALLAESSPDPYICDENMNCYTLYAANESTIKDGYDCHIYTRKSSDPIPTETLKITDICTPSVLTDIIIPSTLDSRYETTITNENDPSTETYIITDITIKQTITRVYSDSTVCATPTTTVKSTVTEKSTFYNNEFDNLDVNEKNEFVFEDYDKEFVSIPMTIPEGTEEYAVDCEFQFEYNDSYYRIKRRDLSAKAISSSPVKTIPPKTYQFPPYSIKIRDETVSSSTTKNTSTIAIPSSTSKVTSVKTIPPKTFQFLPYRVLFPDKKTNKYRTDIDEYCENDDHCFKKYTEFSTKYYTYYHTTHATCAFYTKTNKPENGSATRTSLCRPTSSYYLSKSTIDIAAYTTTYNNSNDYVTKVISLVRSIGDVMTVKTYCIQNDDYIPVTSTQTSKAVPIISTSSKAIPTTTTSSKTIPTSTTSSKTIPTTTTSSKTIPTTTPSVNITTKTPPVSGSTKCIPTTVTVTEKETITKKETVTVTVIASNAASNANCAKKWAQCGGQDFNGPTCCEAGSTCRELNKYYSQCV